MPNTPTTSSEHPKKMGRPRGSKNRFPRVDPDVLLVPEQIAGKYLGLADGEMHLLREGQKGPVFIQIGEAFYYRPNDLNSWLTGATLTN